MLKPPLSVLRKQKINIGAYIDDLLLTNKTFEETSKVTRIAVSLLESLGFIIHLDLLFTSVFTPTQTIEYLGFIIESRKMLVVLTKKRRSHVKELRSGVCLSYH